jgi:hypothetical protein
MRKILSATAAIVIATAIAGHWIRSGGNHPAILGNQANAATAPAGTRVPLDQIDHSVWNGLLNKYVDDDGMVNYAAWKASASDANALKQYLAALGCGDPAAATTKAGKLAFWINAYNALTVHGILQVYPTSSIRNHTAKLIGYNIWQDLPLPVAGAKYSLEDIEHKILRKLGEPRIHFAIVCASIGCPRLRNEAYTPQAIESQLADNARDFFSRKRNLQVDPSGREVRVSTILEWFGEDFGSTPQKALAWSAAYMPDDATRQLIEAGGFTVRYLDYDWNLNKQ